MIHGRSESAGLCVLRKHVVEAKEGSLELRRKQAKVCTLKEEKEERFWHAQERDLYLKRLYLLPKVESLGENLNRIFIRCSSVYPHGCGHH